jgi:hypothetical protein
MIVASRAGWGKDGVRSPACTTNHVAILLIMSSFARTTAAGAVLLSSTLLLALTQSTITHTVLLLLAAPCPQAETHACQLTVTLHHQQHVPRQGPGGCCSAGHAPTAAVETKDDTIRITKKAGRAGWNKDGVLTPTCTTYRTLCACWCHLHPEYQQQGLSCQQSTAACICLKNSQARHSAAACSLPRHADPHVCQLTCRYTCLPTDKGSLANTYQRSCGCCACQLQTTS